MMLITDRRIAEVLAPLHRVNADMLNDKIARDPQRREVCEEKMRLLEEIARDLGVDILNPGAYAAQQTKAAPRQRDGKKGKVRAGYYYITA